MSLSQKLEVVENLEREISMSSCLHSIEKLENKKANIEKSFETK